MRLPRLNPYSTGNEVVAALDAKIGEFYADGLNPYSTGNEVVAATKSFELKINEL